MELSIPLIKSIPVTNRERWAWYLYDFGNSAYAAVVLLAVYSAYFKGEVVGGAEGTRLWGYSVGIAMLIVAVISPILGAIADYSGTKKRFLLFFTVLSCIFTAALFFVLKGDIVIGMVFFILAEVGYRSSQVFYNALLPEISSPEEMGRISGNGWAIGSAGGIVCLLVVLALIMTFPGSFIIRISFFITAAFFAISALPLFLLLKERRVSQPLPEGKNYLSLAFGQLGKTFKSIRKFKELLKFIVAFIIFNDGIMITMDFAAIIGAVLFGLEQQQLIIFMIIVQVTSVLGAYVTGWAADRFSGKYSLVVSIILMIAAIIWLFYCDSVTTFYYIGALAGFALTGVQSVSRMMIGKLSPPSQSAEFYGFFAIAGRSSSFIGPAIYGWVAAEAALLLQSQGINHILAEQYAQRYSILLIGIFLVVGLFLLMIVNEKKGIAVARESEN